MLWAFERWRVTANHQVKCQKFEEIRDWAQQSHRERNYVAFFENKSVQAKYANQWLLSFSPLRSSATAVPRLYVSRCGWSSGPPAASLSASGFIYIRLPRSHCGSFADSTLEAGVHVQKGIVYSKNKEQAFNTMDTGATGIVVRVAGSKSAAGSAEWSVLDFVNKGNLKSPTANKINGCVSNHRKSRVLSSVIWRVNPPLNWRACWHDCLTSLHAHIAHTSWENLLACQGAAAPVAAIWNKRSVFLGARPGRARRPHVGRTHMHSSLQGASPAVCGLNLHGCWLSVYSFVGHIFCSPLAWSWLADWLADQALLTCPSQLFSLIWRKLFLRASGNWKTVTVPVAQY